MAAETESRQRYVVMPIEGYRSEALRAGILLSNGHGLKIAARAGTVDRQTINVLDSIHEDGPKLVELTPEALYALRAEYNTAIRVVPLTYFSVARATPGIPARGYKTKTTGAVPQGHSRSNIVDSESGRPIAGARLIAFTDYRNRIGDDAVSGTDGIAELGIAAAADLQRLYVFGPAGYWGYYARNTRIGAHPAIKLERVNVNSQRNLLYKCFGHLPEDAGEGVRIGIIDSGVDRQHQDIKVVGGQNLVYDETADNSGASDEYGPGMGEGGDHGTHVAGLAAARGKGQGRFRGVAPQAEIVAYRVFPKNGGHATNYDIAKAIDLAVQQDCHVLNLSLGGTVPDELLRLSIEEAVKRGVMVVAAAGNDRRGVAYPAAYPGVVGVSACGYLETYPEESTESADRVKPFGKPDAGWFAAAFTNSGPQVDMTGPGVGIVSTLPGNDYGVMSGTSMASPAIAGFAAAVLSARPDLLRDSSPARSHWVFSEMQTRLRSLGLGAFFEGFGLPR